MYTPPPFRMDELESLQHFVDQHPFATLVTTPTPGPEAGEGPVVGHFPFFLDRTPGTPGVLWGHIARANDQWRHHERPVVVVFHGAHAYISPAWYRAEGVVPTWNYQVVHAHGTMSPILEPEALRVLLARQLEQFERGEPEPWDLGRSGEVVDRLLCGIVGLRIEVTRWEGKSKLGQNHPESRVNRAARELMERGPMEREIGRLMMAARENRG